MNLFSSLRREQRESAFLLQTGTFLEYFDLMLYVQMAVLLNEIFFPQTDPHTTALLTAFAFCSLFIMRALGALALNYIGDKIGYTAIVIFTTTTIAISCIIIINLPTYAHMGIFSAWMVTLCRMVLGFSSGGERIGTELYIMEITKPSTRYLLTASVGLSAEIGTAVALALASLSTTHYFNWRTAFCIGIFLAICGSAARMHLRETPNFVDMKRRMKRTIEEAKDGGFTRAAELFKKTNPIWGEPIPKRIIAAYFLIHCVWPLAFYFSYIYCGTVLKTDFGYTAAQIIHQNFLISVVGILFYLLISLCSSKIDPLKLLKTELFFLYPMMSLFPMIFMYIHSPYFLFVIQCVGVILSFSATPSSTIFYTHFPIFRRFQYTNFIHIFATAFMSIVVSFGFVYLTEFFGHGGILLIILPIVSGFTWSVRYFEKLERKREIFYENVPNTHSKVA